MSISQAHSDAARRNGSASSGPTTEAGKARSSRNAARHCLFGSTSLLSPEDRDAFDELTAVYMMEHNPETPTETHYVRDMIDAEWRLTRTRTQAASIQQTRLNRISASPTATDCGEAFRQLAGEGNSLSLLLRYENQFRRQYDKSLSQLMELRKRGQTEQEQTRREALQEQIGIIQEIENEPTPGDLMDPAELQAEIGRTVNGTEAAPAFEHRTAPESGKSNPINLQKEPKPSVDRPVSSASVSNIEAGGSQTWGQAPRNVA